MYVPCGQTTTWDLCIQTHKLCRSFVGDFDLAHCCCNHPSAGQRTTTHARPKTREWFKKKTSDGLFFPTHLAAQILLPQTSTSLEPPKLSSVGKVSRAVTRLLKVWSSGCEYNIQPGIRKGQWHLVLAGARLLKLMKMYRKTRCVIQPFGILSACP